MGFGTVSECGNVDEQGTRSRRGHLDHQERLSDHGGQCSARGRESPRRRRWRGPRGTAPTAPATRCGSLRARGPEAARGGRAEVRDPAKALTWTCPGSAGTGPPPSPGRRGRWSWHSGPRSRSWSSRTAWTGTPARRAPGRGSHSTAASCSRPAARRRRPRRRRPPVEPSTVPGPPAAGGQCGPGPPAPSSPAPLPGEGAELAGAHRDAPEGKAGRRKPRRRRRLSSSSSPAPAPVPLPGQEGQIPTAVASSQLPPAALGHRLSVSWPCPQWAEPTAVVSGARPEAGSGRRRLRGALRRGPAGGRGRGPCARPRLARGSRQLPLLPAPRAREGGGPREPRGGRAQRGRGDSGSGGQPRSALPAPGGPPAAIFSPAPLTRRQGGCWSLRGAGPPPPLARAHAPHPRPRAVDSPRPDRDPGLPRARLPRPAGAQRGDRPPRCGPRARGALLLGAPGSPAPLAARASWAPQTKDQIGTRFAASAEKKPFPSVSLPLQKCSAFSPALPPSSAPSSCLFLRFFLKEKNSNNTQRAEHVQQAKSLKGTAGRPRCGVRKNWEGRGSGTARVVQPFPRSDLSVGEPFLPPKG